MKGIIGKKIGMTSLYNADGKQIACTIIEAGPCTVTQVKTQDNDGYNAVQLGFGDKKEKNTSNGLKGHFSKASATPKSTLKEFKDFSIPVALGDTITADTFEAGQSVDIIGTSKGKGFQGVVKRHHFSGVGMASHGQHNRLRAPGSIGACSTPSRVFKGIRMAGRMGQDRVKMKSMKVFNVIADQNLIIIAGSIPGANGSHVVLQSK